MQIHVCLFVSITGMVMEKTMVYIVGSTAVPDKRVRQDGDGGTVVGIHAVARLVTVHG